MGKFGYFLQDMLESDNLTLNMAALVRDARVAVCSRDFVVQSAGTRSVGFYLFTLATYEEGIANSSVDLLI